MQSLCQKIIYNDPTQNCIIKGSHNSWEGLQPDQSLFHSRLNCGLPIGNLTSQRFANFYMNTFDHFIKRDLKIRYYGRYVDDFLLVHQDYNYLKSLIPRITDFLSSELMLTLHPKKIHLQHCSYGVPFLGVVIKPHRIYVGDRTKGNFYTAIKKQNNICKNETLNRDAKSRFLSTINTYLGLMKHYNTYQLRKKMLLKFLSPRWWNIHYSSGGYAKLTAKQKTIKRKGYKFHI